MSLLRGLLQGLIGTTRREVDEAIGESESERQSRREELDRTKAQETVKRQQARRFLTDQGSEGISEEQFINMFDGEELNHE